MADAALPSAIRVWVTSSPISFAVAAATPRTGWKPWLNQPLHRSVLRGPSMHGLAVWQIDLLSDHPGHDHVAARDAPASPRPPAWRPSAGLA